MVILISSLFRFSISCVYLLTAVCRNVSDLCSAPEWLGCLFAVAIVQARLAVRTK